jgi:hypothetical protein
LVLGFNLLISLAMVTLTIVVHFAGLAALIACLRGEFARRWREGSAYRRGFVILFTVFGLVVLHAIEIWIYAGLYLFLGLVPTLETALYFSTSTFTTLGFGDVVIDSHHRIIAAIEGFNGFLLIGWSTAFLVSVTGKMGLLEAQLEAIQRSRDDPPRDSP